MGRVWRREIIAIRCEVRSCSVSEPLTPALHHETTWVDYLPYLSLMVARGWSAVLTETFRTYCPEHAARARQCTCRTNPARKHLCVPHGDSIVALVWDQAQTPNQVSLFQKVS